MWKVFNFYNSDFDGLLKLTVEYYGNVEISNDAYLMWQYFSNPSGDAIIKIAKNDAGEIVGQYVLLPMDVKAFDKTIRATLSLNTLTRDDYQGKGIFTALSEMAFSTCQDENYGFTYGYPNQNSYPGFIKKLNFVSLHNVPLLIYPCNLRSLVRKRFSKFLSYFVPNIFFRMSKTSTHADNVIEISLDKISLLDDFWNRVKPKYNMMISRDKNFLKWRYFDIPTRDYKIFAYEERGAVLGYIVLCLREVDNVKNGMIVDFLVNENSLSAGKCLIDKSFSFFKQNNAELLGCLMLEHTQEYEILRQSGYIKCPKILEPQPFPVIYRAHSEDFNTDEMKNINNWFVTMGDYDAV